MFDNNASYEECPQCGGTGQVPEPGTGTMVICSYCKGIGVVAFLESKEPTNVINDSVSAKKTKYDILKMFIFLAGISIIGYIVYLLRTSDPIIILDIFTYGFIWGGGLGAILALIIIALLNYMPILSGIAVYDEGNYVINDAKKYTKQTRLLLTTSIIILIVCSQVNLILAFLVIIIGFCIEMGIISVNYYSKKAANQIIRVFFIIAAVGIIILVIFLLTTQTLLLFVY
jgi:hypothetical protein